MAPNFATILGLNMLSVALPTVRDAFGMDTGAATWIVTAYSLPFAVLMPLYGTLGDTFGKRQALIVGIALFVVGSVLAACASALPALLAARALQGSGAAACFPLGMALVADSFASEKQGRLLGTWNSVNPATSVVAPVLGGALVAYLGWRSIFWPPALAGAGAILAVVAWVPDDAPRRSSPSGFWRNLDAAGLIGLFLTVLLFILYLLSETVTGVPALRDYRLGIGAAACGVVLVLFEGRQSSPFLDPAILRLRSFLVGTLCSALRMFTIGAVSLLVPLHLADVFHAGTLTAGMVLTANGLALFILMRAGGAISDTHGPVCVLRFGFLLQALALVPALLIGHLSVAALAVPVILQGLPASLIQAPIHQIAIKDVSAGRSGVASGLYSLFRYLGLTMGTVTCGLVLRSSSLAPSPAIYRFQIAWAVVAAAAFLGAITALLLPGRPAHHGAT